MQLVLAIGCESLALVYAGVEFSQVNFVPFYIAAAIGLASLHVVSWLSIPRRLISPLCYRVWSNVLLALLMFSWICLAIGFVWPELLRGRDVINLFALVGCAVVAPVATLLASAVLRIFSRGKVRAD